MFLTSLPQSAGGELESLLRLPPKAAWRNTLRFLGSLPPLRLNAHHLGVLCWATAVAPSPSAAHGAIVLPTRSGSFADTARASDDHAKLVAHSCLQGEPNASSI